MTTEDILKAITNKLVTLPDAVGLAKCAGFYMIYQAVETLKETIAEDKSKYETEIKALKERIKELEEQTKN